MEINKRMFEIMKEKNIKMTDLANYLDINKTVVSSWKNRGTNPPVEYVVQICTLLQISIEKFITGKENQELEPKEKLLIEAYRRADEQLKKAILSNAEILAPELQDKSSTYKIG